MKINERTFVRPTQARASAPKAQKNSSTSSPPASVSNQADSVSIGNSPAPKTAAPKARNWNGILKTAGVALMLGLAIAGPLSQAFGPSAAQPQAEAVQVLEQKAPETQAAKEPVALVQQESSSKASSSVQSESAPVVQQEATAEVAQPEAKAPEASRPEREVFYTAKNPNAPSVIEQQEGRPSKGIKYDYTRAEFDAAVQNSVTADQLEEGDYRFTANDVDPVQSSKLYHDSESLAERPDGYQTVKHNNKGKMCASESKDGEKCRSGFMNETSHSVLSCVYRNEVDGELYRVVHRSESHRQTESMQKNVCGGHSLNMVDGAWSPQQTSGSGDILYLNPDNIIQVQSVTQAESAQFGG